MFDDDGAAAVGLIEDGAVYDVSALGSEPAIALAAGRRRVLEVAGPAPARALEDVRLLAPAI
jgi:hypothetical protein